MRTILSEDEINRIMSDYRGGGYSNEVLEIAENDLRCGITREQQSWYMVKTFEPAKVRSLSEAIRENIPDSLIKLMYRLDRYQIDVVVRQFKAGIPEDELAKVIRKKYSAHDMQMVFDKLQKELMNTKPAPEENETLEYDISEEKVPNNNESENNEFEKTDSTEKEKVPEQTVETKSIPATDNCVSSDEQNVEDKLSNEVLMKSFETMMEKLNSTIDNLTAVDSVAEQRLNATIDDMEKRIKSLNKELEMSAGIIAERENEIAQLKERVREMEDNGTEPKKDGGLEQYAERVDTNVTMTMPDGSVVPLRIEHTENKNHKGMAGFATRFFNGNLWQKSLLNMLIDGHLNKDQLAAIKQARDYNFSDQEIKELIESGLPAEEMSGIIEVVMSDRI